MMIDAFDWYSLSFTGMALVLILGLGFNRQGRALLGSLIMFFALDVLAYGVFFMPSGNVLRDAVYPAEALFTMYGGGPIPPYLETIQAVGVLIMGVGLMLTSIAAWAAEVDTAEEPDQVE